MAYTFPSLVADPVSSLLSSAPLVAALQLAYVTICLPNPNDHQHSKTTKRKGAAAQSEMGWGFKIVVRRLPRNPSSLLTL